MRESRVNRSSARLRIWIDEDRGRRNGNRRARGGIRPLPCSRSRALRAQRLRGRTHEHRLRRAQWAQARARYGLHRPQRAELPEPRPALSRPWRGDPGVGHVLLGELPRLRARVLEPEASRSAAKRSRPALPAARHGHPALPANCPFRDRGAGLRRRNARGVPCHREVLAHLRRALRHPADSCDLVDGARAGARYPCEVRDPVLRQPRDARFPPPSLEDRDRRKPSLRPRDPRSHEWPGSSCLPGDIGCPRAERRRDSHRRRTDTPFRSRGDCSSRGRIAGATRRSV